MTYPLMSWLRVLSDADGRRSSSKETANSVAKWRGNSSRGALKSRIVRCRTMSRNGSGRRSMMLGCLWLTQPPCCYRGSIYLVKTCGKSEVPPSPNQRAFRVSAAKDSRRMANSACARLPDGRPQSQTADVGPSHRPSLEVGFPPSQDHVRKGRVRRLPEAKGKCLSGAKYQCRPWSGRSAPHSVATHHSILWAGWFGNVRQFEEPHEALNRRRCWV